MKSTIILVLLIMGATSALKAQTVVPNEIKKAKSGRSIRRRYMKTA